MRNLNEETPQDEGEFCPKCGARGYTVRSIKDRDGLRFYQARCKKCRFATDWRDDEEDAIWHFLRGSK